MSAMTSRIENEELRRRVLPLERAVRFVKDGDTLAVSGFTKAGEPKAFLPALARHFTETSPEARISLFSGASLSDEVENPIAPFIRRRGPYMSSTVSRSMIHSGRTDFTDVHLSQFARNMMYGFYGEIDLAVIEVSRIRPDGSVVLTSSVGVSPEALARAHRIILEVNTAGPIYTGFHDIVLPTVHPRICWPIPITNVSDRAGTPYAEIDKSKVVAVVESTVPEYPVAFKPVTKTDKRIAQNVVEFLQTARKRYGWAKRLPPIQSGVGNVANAIIGELYDSPFAKIRFWTEVFQDGMLRFLEDDEKFEAASATALSFSAKGLGEFHRLFNRARDKVVLRPMWISNSAELISRLFVIAMNTPIEVDIYGHVNSTHVGGSKIINGIGGSGDFFRNSYIGIVHTPSVRRLKDGRFVSCIMPYVRHIDHTEHDIKCVVTDQGFAETTEIRSGRNRALEIIRKCAHPHFRPLLLDYLERAGSGDEPRPQDIRDIERWWKEYDRACWDFPASQGPRGRKPMAPA